MRLHPEVPLIALFGLVHLRVAGLALVLGRGRGGDDGGVDDGTLAHQQAALLQHPADFVKQHPGQLVALQPMAALSSRPEPGRGSAQCRQSCAAPGCRTAHPPALRRPARTIAAKSKSAACAPARSASARAHPLGRAVADAPPAGPMAPPAPSQPKICHAASASSCRRIPPAKSSPAAASSRPSVPPDRRTAGPPDRRILPDPRTRNPPYFSVSLAVRNPRSVMRSSSSKRAVSRYISP